MEILIYIFIFGFYLFLCGDRRKTPVFTLYLCLYFGGMCTAFYLWNFTDYFSTGTQYQNSLSILAIIYHVIILMIMLYPLKKYEIKINSSKLPQVNYRIIRPVFYLTMIVSFLVLYYGILTIRNRSGMSIIDIRGAMMSGEGRSVQSKTFIAYILSVAKLYTVIVEFFFFYCICRFPQKKLVILLLLLSSLAFPISSMQSAGREYILRYVFYFFIMYLLFKKEIPKTYKKIIIGLFLILIIVFVFVFMYITVARFGSETRASKPVLDSLLMYWGESYIFFSNYFTSEGETGGKLCFSFLPGDSFGGYKLSQKISTDYILNVFGTYVGSMVFDLGWLKALIPLGIYTVLFYIVARIRSDNLFFYVYCFLIYEFMFAGMFFYNQKLDGARLLSLIILVGLHFLYSNFHKNNHFIS